MASDIAQYRCHQISEGLDVLRALIERRVPPDEAIDTRIFDLQIELKLLVRELEKEK